MTHNVIIIGSGPAGQAAAIYAARADLKPLVIAGRQPLGQLMETTEVENYPGFPEGVQGPELMQNMKKQAERFGAEFIDKDATAVDFSDKPLKVSVDKETYETYTVIIATGSAHRKLGIPSEEIFAGKGVSYCATCDGAFFRDKEIFVVGGGDSALEEANFLTKFASKVTILVRKDMLRASKAMQHRTEQNKKIEILYNTEVQEIVGDKVMTGIKVINNQTSETSELPGQGIFVAIGQVPQTHIFADQVKVGEQGHIERKPEPNAEMKTSVPGVFVAGDVWDYRYRQAITSASSGTKAALDAERYLAETGLVE
ncbi:thioredoxin-disulfide reductase [Patescibacteria group bacterium]